MKDGAELEGAMAHGSMTPDRANVICSNGGRRCLGGRYSLADASELGGMEARHVLFTSDHTLDVWIDGAGSAPSARQRRRSPASSLIPKCGCGR